MAAESIDVIKSSGEKVRFSLDKLRGSLRRSGADKKLIDTIIDTVRDELYQGISTKEIYNRAFAMLKRKKSIFASKYKLKKAIYELGPTGFPFERFIGALLEYSGYDVKIGKYIKGKCVTHEVDVIARKNSDYIIAECKFHGDDGRKCDVKIPLYINSRYADIVAFQNMDTPTEGWVVTNTRFTSDALDFGLCSGLYLLSWDYPEKNSLRERIDRLGLYPITVSTLLTQREKQFLLSRDIVLCRQLYKDDFYLDHLGISEKRKGNIMSEVNMLCNL
jgi:hypothetical protein